ncbi:hypothetical protein, partial [Eggerthella lenta]|uniref:hypothetical protein n=1 Tax=Eggerthella lenta TaxID=84112 RepID=UPI003DA5EAC7
MGVLYNPVVLRACFMHLFFGLDILSMINENAFLQVPLGRCVRPLWISVLCTVHAAGPPIATIPSSGKMEVAMEDVLTQLT